MKRVLLLTLALCGCVDAEPILAPPVLPAYAQAPCTLSTTTYRVVDVELPVNARRAEELDFDLDRDPTGRIDNAAGVLVANLIDREPDRPAPVEVALRQALSSGLLAWYVHVQRCVGDHYARVAVTGDATPPRRGVAPPAAVGWSDGEHIEASEGVAEVPVSAFFRVTPEAAATWTVGLALAASIDVTADELSGAIGFAVGGSSLANLDYGDGFVEAAAIPDLDLVALYRGELVYWPRHDGRWDHMSMGIGVRAVRVR